MFFRNGTEKLTTTIKVLGRCKPAFIFRPAPGFKAALCFRRKNPNPLDSYLVVGLMKSRPRFQFRKKYFLEKIFKLTKMAYFLGNVYACIVYPNKGKLSTFFKLYLLTRYFLD